MTDAAPKVPSKDTLYCHRDAQGKYTYFFPSRGAVKMCSVPDDEIVHVRLVADEEGTHWGWHDYERDEYCMVWPSLMQLKVCFAYGIEIEEQLGKGIRTRLRVEEIAA